MVSTQPSQLADFIQAASEQRTNPGVIVLTHQGHLLYMNREATEFCAEINQARLGQMARGVLPIEVVNLCHAIAEQVTAVQDVKAWEGTIEVSRLVQLVSMTGWSNSCRKVRGCERRTCK